MSYRQYIIPIMVSALALIISSCKNDDEPQSQIPANAVYDFVTLVQSGQHGSTFELQKADDSPVITYTSGYDLAAASTHVSVGDRVIICYRRADGEVYTSGKITLYAYLTLSNTEQEAQSATAKDTDGWASGPFAIKALWRSGNYINLQSNIYGFKAVRPKKFELVADAETLTQEMPVLHLIYADADNNKGENPYGVNASFDISKIWNLENCRGVVVEYPTKGGSESMTFKK